MPRQMANILSNGSEWPALFVGRHTAMAAACGSGTVGVGSPSP
jgi:hypothetical protein